MPSDSSDFVSALPRLRRYARILAHDPRRADDMVKETLSRARQAEHELPSDPAPLLPLLSLLRSVYVDLYAPGRSRGPELSFAPRESSPAVGGASTDKPSEANVRCGDLLARLWRLPVEDREVLVLFAVERMSYEDIATLLAVPVATVLARVTHARNSVRSGALDEATTPKRAG
jgi:RNA polymerase sigma-70 factor (ECF subfamily)